MEEIEGPLMELLRNRLTPFNVPNDVVRAIRDDVVKLVTPASTKKKFGASVMTAEASAAADKSNPMPGSGKPRIV